MIRGEFLPRLLVPERRERLNEHRVQVVMFSLDILVHVVYQNGVEHVQEREVFIHVREILDLAHTVLLAVFRAVLEQEEVAREFVPFLNPGGDVIAIITLRRCP